MTKTKEQAIELLHDMPDEMVVYVIDILRGMKGISEIEKSKVNAGKKRKSSMGFLSEYANVGLISQEKEAWGNAVREKYADH